MGRKVTRLIVAAVLVSALAFAVGCSDSNTPTSPNHVPDNYSIVSEYLCYPGGEAPGLPYGASVQLTASGTWWRVAVSGAFFNGSSLAFYTEYNWEVNYWHGGSYWGDIDAECGETAMVTVGDRCGTWTGRGTIPFAPTSLALSGDAWDASDPAAENVLTWENPDVLGGYLQVMIFDDGGDSPVRVYCTKISDPSTESITITNSQLSGATDMTSVLCVVYMANYKVFSDSPARSLLTRSGDWDIWPVAE